LSAPLIEIRGVVKTFQLEDVEVHALRGVSLAVERGEFVAIMGASGSGKSTLMNILGCLDRPTRGTYRLGGVPVSDMTPDQRAALRNRGARQVEAAMAFRLPMTTTAEEMVLRARQALLQRPELWADGTADGAAAGDRACRERHCPVSAGQVWIGDTGVDAPPGAAAPRLYSVKAFVIDEGEATVAAYARCVAAGACPEVNAADAFCRELVKGDATLPQPCVSFTAAQAYCKWDGGRLPTEAEWMRAARGHRADVFPWGTTLESGGDPLRGNFGEKPSSGYPNYAVVPETAAWPADGYRGLAPPCSFPAGRSPFGVCDLAGNLSEWVVSDADGTVVVLGSSWLDGERGALHLGLRYVLPALPPAMAQGGSSSALIGFRCVR